MLVLASASPRRRDLIALLGLPFQVVPSKYQEPSPPALPVSLSHLVISLASKKALEVAERLGDDSATVIGADTLVTVSDTDFGIPLGKPKDAKDAARMLESLSGRSHSVHTGIALAQYTNSDVVIAAASSVCTSVTFRSLTSEMIEDYVRTGEPMDKAGAYGAQGYGAPFIASFSGDFYNVVGLPVCTLGGLLESIGITWWRNRSDMPPLTG